LAILQAKLFWHLLFWRIQGAQLVQYRYFIVKFGFLLLSYCKNRNKLLRNTDVNLQSAVKTDNLVNI